MSDLEKSEHWYRFVVIVDGNPVGVVYVLGGSADDAKARAKDRRYVPEGAKLEGHPIPPGDVPPPQYRNRLLSNSESEEAAAKAAKGRKA